MVQQRFITLVHAVVLLVTVQIRALEVYEVPNGPAHIATAAAQTASPAAQAVQQTTAAADASASQISPATVTAPAATKPLPAAQLPAASLASPASATAQPAATGGSQQAVTGAAQTAAAAAETAAEAAQTAAAAAVSAAQSAAAAAGSPNSQTLPPSHVVSPVVQQMANLGSAASTPAAAHQAVSAAAAVRAATSAASMEKTAAAAAESAASAAKVADTAAEAVTAHSAAVTASKAADSKERTHPSDDVAKASAAASAAASAQKAADSAASAAASAASAARAATTAEKTVTAMPSTPVAQAAAVAPHAKPVEAVPSQPQAPGSAAPGVQVTAAVPVHVSEKELQRLPAQISAGSNFWSSSQWWILQASTLIAGITFAMVVKALCVCGNVMVQVSPLPQVRRWELRQCTGEADAAPYVSIAFGGWQWCFYGFFAWWVTARSGFLILVHSNCLGAVLGTYYCFTFYRNCRNEAFLSSLQKYLSAVTALALLQVCAMSVLPPERALFLTGLISSFCGFIGATSVLVTVPQVVRNKDSRSIPGPYACANFCSSIIWSLCGWLLDDPLVMVPSLFSTCCAMTALSCKALYPSTEGAEKEGLEVSTSIEAGNPKQKASKGQLASAPTEFTPMKLPKATGTKHTSSDTLLHSALIAVGDKSYDGTGGTC